MKLYTILAFALVVMLMFATSLALAEEDSVISPAPSSETSTDIDAETVAALNDELDESVSPLRIGWENIKLGFTFNNEKKAIQELKIARLRLVQARIAARNNDTEAMQNALEAHNRILERVQSRVNAIDGASDEEGALLAAGKLVGLERAIEVHEARISKLNEILASENLTEDQRAKIEKHLEQAENNTAQLRALEAEKKERIKTRLRAVGNMTDEEADAEIEEIEDAANLKEVRKAVAEAKLEHAKKVLENLKERLEKAEEKGKEIAKIEERLSEAENRLEAAKERIKERSQNSSDDDSADDSSDDDSADDSSDDEDLDEDEIENNSS